MKVLIESFYWFQNMNTYDTILGSAQSKFVKLVKRPERYLKPDQELFDEIKLLSKAKGYDCFLFHKCISVVLSL